MPISRKCAASESILPGTLKKPRSTPSCRCKLRSMLLLRKENRFRLLPEGRNAGISPRLSATIEGHHAAEVCLATVKNIDTTHEGFCCKVLLFFYMPDFLARPRVFHPWNADRPNRAAQGPALARTAQRPCVTTEIQWQVIDRFAPSAVTIEHTSVKPPGGDAEGCPAGEC